MRNKCHHFLLLIKINNGDVVFKGKLNDSNSLGRVNSIGVKFARVAVRCDHLRENPQPRIREIQQEIFKKPARFGS